MKAHLSRPFEAFTLVIFATLMIAGILSTHTMAPSRPPVQVSVSTATNDDPAAQVPSATAGTASTAGAGPSVGGFDGDSKCCTEPVECVETLTVISVMFAALNAPAAGHSVDQPVLPLSVDGRGAVARQAPSLLTLSISRV